MKQGRRHVDDSLFIGIDPLRENNAALSLGHFHFQMCTTIHLKNNYPLCLPHRRGRAGIFIIVLYSFVTRYTATTLYTAHRWLLFLGNFTFLNSCQSVGRYKKGTAQFTTCFLLRSQFVSIRILFFRPVAILFLCFDMCVSVPFSHDSGLRLSCDEEPGSRRPTTRVMT